MWEDGAFRRLKTMTCNEREFETPGAARREGIELAKKWIDAGKPER
jgi:hypothetical protein